MGLLTDSEILSALEQGRIRLDPRPELLDPFGKDSVIQPSSLDLTIGRIAVPPSAKSTGGAFEECTQHSLQPGMTVFDVSAKTGEGMGRWLDFLRASAAAARPDRAWLAPA